MVYATTGIVPDGGRPFLDRCRTIFCASGMLSDAQRAFVDLLFKREALKFGDFTLKSGRKSPYFINAGCFNNGGGIARPGSTNDDEDADDGERPAA